MFSLLTKKAPKNAIVNFVKRGFAEERRSNEKSLNQVMLLGRAGSDPQTKGTEDHPVVTFSIATNTKIKSSGEEAARVSTDWHRVCCFQPKLREMTTKYLQRGSRVLVTGKIAYGQIVDGQGSVHQTTSIVADNIIFLTNARQSEEPDVDEEGIPETEVFQHQKSSIME